MGEVSSRDRELEVSARVRHGGASTERGSDGQTKFHGRVWREEVV